MAHPGCAHMNPVNKYKLSETWFVDNNCVLILSSNKFMAYYLQQYLVKESGSEYLWSYN